MGYETQIYVVREYSFSFPHDKFNFGEELACLRLSKCSNEFNEFIDKFKKSKGKKWAVYARNPDRQREAVEFIRKSAEDLNGKEKDDLIELSNNIEDGYISKDCYGDKLGCIPIQEFIDFLESQEHKRWNRMRIALSVCKEIKEVFNYEADKLFVLTFGY